ncbi:hypothetical protein M9Y10_032788 [Tritrichomonas musculus]|uniref:Ankyrin n=1 Tax=Tritrichomonas musculus TaxID=1915356 RepID=A0ABR2GXT3_9EUKA
MCRLFGENGYLTLFEIIYKTTSIDPSLIFNDKLLIEVLKKGHFDIFKFIMENKPDKIELKVDINKILFIAVQNENVKAVKFLLENPNIDINSYFDKGNQIVQYKDDINVNTNVDKNETEIKDITKEKCQFIEYKTALHIAVETGNTEILSLLLNHPNIKVNSKTVEKKIGGSEDSYGDLVYNIVSYTRIMKSALHIAIQNNDYESVELLLDDPFIDVNSISKHEYRYYYSYQRERSFGYCGNSVNASELKTCLFSAIENLNIKIIQLLLSKSKIDVNHPSCIITNRDEFKNYLDILASDDVLEKVDFYEDDDIEPKIIEQTPLSLAFEKENDDIISLLLSYPTIDAHQDNALSKGIKIGNVDIYYKLLSQNRYDGKEFNSALHNAVESGNIDMVKTILNRPGIDVNGDLNGKTAIQIAASKGNLEIFNHLLCHPDFDIMHNYCGQKALNEAAENGNLDIFKVLLEKPEIDINYRSQTGFTVLHHAVRGLNIDIVNLLLERPDMNINVMSNDNITPFQIAADLQNVEIIRAFLKRNDAQFDPDTIYPNINGNQVKIVTFSLINSIKVENPGNQEIWNKLDEKFLFYIFHNFRISSTSTLNFFLNQLYQFKILNKIILNLNAMHAYLFFILLYFF